MFTHGWPAGRRLLYSMGNHDYAEAMETIKPEGIKTYESDFDRIADDDLFKVLSEPVRIRIIRFLAVHGPSDVGTIAASFPQDRSVISRHLKMMLGNGLVCAEKKARNTVYSFDGFAFLDLLEALTGMVRGFLGQYCDLGEKKTK